MTSIRKALRGMPPSVIFLGCVLLFVMVVGLVFALVVWAATSISQGLFERRFCLEDGCVKSYFELVSQSLIIAKGSLDLGVAIATIGGIFVALLSYFTAANNGALTNHIEHLKVFGEYLESEIKKRDRLSIQSIDRLLLYGLIFSQSRSGKTAVSVEYQKFIESLNLIIEESNARCSVGTPGGFSYMDHQKKIKNHMAVAGIEVLFSPRNDFFEMEGQLFSLLHRVNQSFCAPGSIPNVVNRSYH